MEPALDFSGEPEPMNTEELIKLLRLLDNQQELEGQGDC